MDDQSKLSYSFDDEGTHYVVLNTDTWTSTPTTYDAGADAGVTEIGWIALAWLTNDLRAAQANAAVKRIFVFGHKPVETSSGKTRNDETISPALTSRVEALFDEATKVKGYFCAHAHEWSTRKLGRRGVTQVIAGNGGSILETQWKPTPAPFFGFTEVRVYESGRVGIVSHQRAAPSPYDSNEAPPAEATTEITIAE